MNLIPPSMQAQLVTGVTTLSWCWELRLVRGDVMRGCDHDRAIVMGGHSFAPCGGFIHDVIEAAQGLGAGRGRLKGSLGALGFTLGEIRAGILDGAELRLWRVDWQAPVNAYLAYAGDVGEVRIADEAVELELRAFSARLQQEIGSTLTRRCRAELGDHACRVDMAGYRTGAIVSAVDGATLQLAVDPGDAEKVFVHGSLEVDGGVFAGWKARISAHDGAQVTLARIPPDITGSSVVLTEGCDKTWTSCGEKFANRLNFQGFPHMPGTDWLTAGPRRRNPS